MIFDAMLFVAAASALAAYVCRLDALSWVRHRAPYIVAHLAGGMVCAWVVFKAGAGEAGPACIVPLAAAVAGLAMTFRAWRNGPPAYTLRRRLSGQS